MCCNIPLFSNKLNIVEGFLCDQTYMVGLRKKEKEKVVWSNELKDIWIEGIGLKKKVVCNRSLG